MHAPLIHSTPTVRLLDPNTINQIAAGEVVERPASVVKELIENAIDAGATRISVDLEDAGCALIRVADNGSGMAPEDAAACLERHATSKIRSVDDLAGVASLGFRGEAVPSIASVSRMTIATAAADGLRTVLRVEGGVPIAAEPVAGPRGTEVRVEDLFFNTPARLKFLKSPTTELGQCLDVLSRYALAYPEIAFTSTHNGQLALQTAGSGDRLEAIAGTWSRELARGLVEVRTEVAGVGVFGFVSPPHLTKPTRALQLTFVNGRPVKSRTLMAAIDQAYRSLTPERRYPVVVLHLEIAPEKVDVNVSPTKSEVRFQHEGQAFDAVRYAVKQALLDAGMIPSAEAIAIANEAIASAGGSTFGQEWVRPEPACVLASPAESAEPSGGPAPISPAFAVAGARYPFLDLLDGLKILGQIMGTFIVAENRKGLVVIDQHVAHERVLYEYLCGLKGPTAIEVQPLLTPETVHVDRRAAALLADKLGLLREAGFDLEPFGGDAFLIRAAPAALRGKSPSKVLLDLVDEMVDAAVARRLTPTREAIWIMSSCKMAVKAGDLLSNAEMEKLIHDLAETENPYLCPHGRPITVTLSADDLLRKFGRK